MSAFSTGPWAARMARDGEAYRAGKTGAAAMGDSELMRRLEAFERQIGYGLPAHQQLIPLVVEAHARGLV